MSMRTILCAITAVCSLGYTAQSASAQVIVTPVIPAPVVVQPAPVVVGSTYTAGYGSYVAAPTYSSLSPVVTTSTYSTLSPVVTSVPVVTTSSYSTLSPVVAATPVVTYRPVVTNYTVPYVAARPVVVSPKVYVPGEPVRNFFKAITP